ncbi:MAG: ribonuclease HII [Patescibacteria group bacterium]|nr:ribonuclease HII [Patescibacteria group bacterium]
MISPNFEEEKKLIENNFLVFGIDEVGRGALAGPVAAAAVVFDPFSNGKLETFLQQKGVNDSKMISAVKRVKLSKLIKRCSLSWGVGLSTAGEIDKKGIIWATCKAMRTAVLAAIQKTNLERKPFLLIDALRVKYVPGVGLANQKAIIRGDQKSLSIAAASIVAKVYRDSLMANLSERFPFYSNFGWKRNKGYGTKLHREAIIHFGKTRYHRESFIKSIKL